jgi:hypothetical protein
MKASLYGPEIRHFFASRFLMLDIATDGREHIKIDHTLEENHMTISQSKMYPQRIIKSPPFSSHNFVIYRPIYFPIISNH